jgi:hypothetical protein
MLRKPMLGERAPDLVLPASNNPRFHFDTAAGRNLVLVFLGAPPSPAVDGVLGEVAAMRSAFDDRLASLFYVVSEPEHIERLAIKQQIPGIRFFVDRERAMALAYGLVPDDRAAAPAGAPVAPAIFVLDRTLRFLQLAPFQERKPYIVPIVARLRQLDAAQRASDSLNHAPVLVAERVFEPDLCRRLIEHYKLRGGSDSGFMQEKGGYTTEVTDYGMKRRNDCIIQDETLRNAAVLRIRERLAPEIKRAFQFDATRIERHIISCYDARIGGYFRPHRDNTMKGTAHRRFAVTLNLNAEEYEGGALRFPEFGDRAYVAPTGGVVVFSCSLLHEATPVTKGVRYAYLPFLYGEADAEVRERNKDFLDVRSGGRARLAGPDPDAEAKAPP